MTTLHPQVLRIDELLAEAGVPGRVRILADAAPTAQAAADQVGCEVGAIANSLIFTTGDGDPLLIMTSGAHRVERELIKEHLGTTIKRATPEFVREHTGQAIGGVAPIGHPRPVRTLVDRDLAVHDQLWAAGGIPHAVFPLTYQELILITGGTEVTVAA